MMMVNIALQLIDEYKEIAKDFMSIYFDTSISYDVHRNWYKDYKFPILLNGHHYTKEEWDSIPHWHLNPPDRTQGAPGPKDFQHISMGELIKRISKGGQFRHFLGGMCVTGLYNYWEDYYRGEIANNLGLERNDLVCDIQGDIRILRNSIIHYKAIAKKDVKNCKILTRFIEGQPIALEREDFFKIHEELTKYLDTLYRSWHTGIYIKPLSNR